MKHSFTLGRTILSLLIVQLLTQTIVSEDTGLKQPPVNGVVGNDAKDGNPAKESADSKLPAPQDEKQVVGQDSGKGVADSKETDHEGDEQTKVSVVEYCRIFYIERSSSVDMALPLLG